MAYHGYGSYGGYDDRRGYGGGGWGDDRRGGWDDGYRDNSDRGWDRGRDRDRNRDRGNFGGGDRRDRSFGGGGGRGGGGFNQRGGGGRGGGNRGAKRPGTSGSGPAKKAKDDNNWAQGDRHEMMQSLFMEEKPENFEEGWMFTVCPAGKRRLIVAADEVTQSYNNGGISDARFKSCLPNGSEAFNEVHKMEDLTVLDTMFHNEAKKCYIIDMMHWRHYPYYDTEADFRFYCLDDKYLQLKNPTEITEDNEYSFELLPKLPCSLPAISEALQKAKENSVKVEGVLFINKSSLYETKDSSDSLWLRVDKLEEVLGIAPPEGLDFEPTSTRDEKKKLEQQERQKLKQQREAATKEAQEQLQGDQIQSEKDESEKNESTDNNLENNTASEEKGENDASATECTAQDYTETGVDEGVWF